MTPILRLVAAVLASLLPATVLAALASSAADFSGVQGQANWRYGIFRQTAPGQVPDVNQSHGYSAAAFVELDVFNGAWVASDALVGAHNNDFLSLSAASTHPNGFGPAPQDQVIWTVRRWTSPLAGTIAIDFFVAKANVQNARGRGVTARFFVDGIETMAPIGIMNTDAIGTTAHLVRDVLPGTVLDFAIDPLGVGIEPAGESIFSARADGTFTTITISAVPEPQTAMLVAAGLLLAVGAASRRRHQK